jgi:hypothetical protein
MQKEIDLTELLQGFHYKQMTMKLIRYVKPKKNWEKMCA